MRSALAALDYGPGLGLLRVREVLIRRGHEVYMAFGGGRPFTEDVAQAFCTAVERADRLLVGLSSSPERSALELAAIRAASAADVPFGLFCYNYGEFNRPWFAEALQKARWIFTIDEAEAEAARVLAPRASVVASGNPDWATFFTPTVPREEMRERLGLGKMKFILGAGSKELVRNVLLWSAIVAGASELGDDMYIGLTRHPADETPLAAYDDILRHSFHPVEIITDKKTDDLLPACDLLVTSISSVGVRAACLRIPVIDHITYLDRQWWKGLSGSELWPPALQGASRVTRTEAEMAQALRRLLNPELNDRRLLTNQQVATFPLKKFVGAAETIASHLTI